MKVRAATPDDVSLIFSFIQKKSEFDRNIGAFSGVLQVSEDKLRKTLFGAIPFSYVLFAMSSGCEIGFALAAKPRILIEISMQLKTSEMKA